MDTTTHRPPTSPGDGRSDSNPKRRSTRPQSEPASDLPEEASLDASRESANPPAADRDPIAIEGDGEDLEGAPDVKRRASASWKRLTDTVERLAEKQDARVTWTALGVGLVLGVILGAIASRD